MSQPLAPETAGTVVTERAGSVVKDYIAITKPKHQFVLLTCWASMSLASPALSAPQVVITLLATALAVASSHVFNQLIDRDIDAVMRRTRNRPIAAGRISPQSAVVFGTTLGVLSVGIMLTQVNLLSALLVIAGMVVYVPVYTYWLKRTSPWCTLVGGAAGAMPTLIGWAAVSGSLSATPLLLFTFMMIWQCPHFFGLLLYMGDDYKEAKVPMVSVVAGIPETLKQTVWYSLIMVACTVSVFLVGAAGSVYLTIAVIFGLSYLSMAVRALINGPAKAPFWGKRLFLYSYLYLALIFISVVADRSV